MARKSKGHKLLRRSILLPVVLCSVIGVAVAQSVWTSSIGYTIIPGASMAWVQNMNLGNIDEGLTGSLALSNVVSLSLTKSQSYTVILTVTNADQLKTQFVSMSLVFKEGTSQVVTISLAAPSSQFTVTGPQNMNLNVAIAWSVLPSITTSGQSISGQVNLSATFA
jgi:hypothetical protein